MSDDLAAAAVKRLYYDESRNDYYVSPRESIWRNEKKSPMGTLGFPSLNVLLCEYLRWLFCARNGVDSSMKYLDYELWTRFDNLCTHRSAKGREICVSNSTVDFIVCMLVNGSSVAAHNNYLLLVGRAIFSCRKLMYARRIPADCWEEVDGIFGMAQIATPGVGVFEACYCLIMLICSCCLFTKMPL